jgi:ribosomal protein S18 acetylase RimI-like enzyme
MIRRGVYGEHFCVTVLQFPRVLIQPLKREHIDAAATLMYDNWHAFYTSHLPPGHLSDKALSEFCRYLDGRHDQAWIAQNHEGMVGIVCVSANFIDELWVRPSYRRQGIGSGLLTAALEHLGRRHFDTVYVSTEHFNHEAAAFFTTHGWCKTATQRIRLQPDFEYQSAIFSTSLSR